MTPDWTAAHAAATDPAPMVIIGGSWTHIPPTPEEVDPFVTLSTLAGVLRWNGQLGPTCTVAAHTWALLRWAELSRGADRGQGAALIDDAHVDLRRALLIHDWHEAWTGDIPRPVKAAARNFGLSSLDTAQTQIDAAIRERFAFAPPSSVRQLAKEMDSAILSAEVVAWEMRPDLLLRVFAKHGDPDPLAIVASLEARRLSERCVDPIRRALDGDEALPPVVSRLWDEFGTLFPGWRK